MFTWALKTYLERQVDTQLQHLQHEHSYEFQVG